MKQSPTNCDQMEEPGSTVLLAANDNFPTIFGPWPETKERARELGSLYYFTGVKCKNNHLSPRVTSSGACRHCAYLWREAHKSEASTYHKNWAKENREDLRKYHTKWRRENEDHVRTRARDNARRLRRSSPEKFAAKAMVYYYKKMLDPTFREAQSLRSSSQSAKRRLAEGSFTADDVKKILTRQKNKCAECGASVKKKTDRHIDHVMPIKLGGSNWPSNLQILCKKCNLTKGAKHPIDWANSRGRLL